MIRLLPLVALLTACASGASKDDTDAAPFTDGDGFPELTGTPTTKQAVIARGYTLIAEVPVDADTAWVRVALLDYATSVTVVQDLAGAGGPSATVRVELPIPVNSPEAPGTYYLALELCSSEGCVDPFRRVVYTRVGDTTTYSRVDYDSPPVTQVGDAHDSGVAIVPFELE